MPNLIKIGDYVPLGEDVADVSFRLDEYINLSFCPVNSVLVCGVIQLDRGIREYVRDRVLGNRLEISQNELLEIMMKSTPFCCVVVLRTCGREQEFPFYLGMCVYVSTDLDLSLIVTEFFVQCLHGLEDGWTFIELESNSASGIWSQNIVQRSDLQSSRSWKTRRRPWEGIEWHETDNEATLAWNALAHMARFSWPGSSIVMLMNRRHIFEAESCARSRIACCVITSYLNRLAFNVQANARMLRNMKQDAIARRVWFSICKIDFKTEDSTEILIQTGTVLQT